MTSLSNVTIWCAIYENEQQPFPVLIQPHSFLYQLHEAARKRSLSLRRVTEIRTRNPNGSVLPSNWEEFYRKDLESLCTGGDLRLDDRIGTGGSPTGQPRLDFIFICQGENEEEEPEDLKEVPAYRYRMNITRGGPSEMSKSGQYFKMQGRTERILDGRYPSRGTVETLGPPIEIFHPCFASFRKNANNEDLAVPNDILLASKDFVHSASGIFQDEASRTAATHETLSNLIQRALLQVSNVDRTAADGAVVYTVNWGGAVRTVRTLIYELKNDVGKGGSAPCTQGGLSMRRFWVQLTSNVVRDSCCCPTFILAAAGPYFMVLGSVFTEAVIVQPLTDYIFAVDQPLNESHYRRVARTFYALHLALLSLEAMWDSLTPNVADPIPSSHPRFYPGVRSYTSRGEDHSLSYLQRLERDSDSVTYLAELDGQSRVVVKFVERYNAIAHDLLALHNLAPRIHFYGPLSTDCRYIQMVVMDYVHDARTAFQVYGNLYNPVPKAVRAAVAGAVLLLHEKGFVFGDLRRENVLLHGDNQVKLIDFDWVGKHDETTYPLAMSNNQEMWVDGMGPLRLMQFEHDEKMLDKYFGQS